MHTLLARALAGPAALVVLLGSPALASDRTPAELRPAGGAAMPLPADCTGGASQAEWAVPSFVRAGESYGVAVQGSASCSNCAGGLAAQLVSITLEAEGAVELWLRPVLRRLVTGACPEPGDALCEGVPLAVALVAGERRTIELPIDCGCRKWGEQQLVAVRVDSLLGDPPLLLTDDQREPCSAWLGDDLGWHDLQSSFGLPGRPLVQVGWGCCQVVGTEPGSWGTLKHDHGDLEVRR